jgi:stage II sporulation protein R
VKRMEETRFRSFSSRLRVAGVLLAALAVLAGMGLRAAGSGEEGEVAFQRGSLIRLHIIANSDSPADQRVKLQVRDDLLRDAGRLFRGTRRAAEAREVVQRNLPLLRAIAERRLRAEGFAYPVAVHYGAYPFPVRTYGDLTLPTGRYQALRVVLGEGRGRNWWCVLFPPLCFLEMDAGLARDRVKVVRGAPGERVAVRVKRAPRPAKGWSLPLSILASPAGP